MNPSVYIETTIVSYLTARASTDPLRAGDIAATQEWWSQSRRGFELFTSAIVIGEASVGDPAAAADRLAVLADLSELPVTDMAKALSNSFIIQKALPAKARVDGLHLAIAATSGIDYLLTWNCRHLANASLRAKIEQVCRGDGFEPPIICTPRELTKVQP